MRKVGNNNTSEEREECGEGKGDMCDAVLNKGGKFTS